MNTPGKNPRPLRVLIIEDSEDDTALVLRQLRRGGFEPTFERVDTAAAMSAALEGQPWDLIVADYLMPQFSAPAALTLLKQSGLDVPFIVVSGSVGEDIAVAAMKSGANDYLMKDNFARLVPAVERELREAAERRKSRRAAESLRDSEERFRLLVEGVKDHAILILDHGGNIVSWNAGVENLTGYGAEEITGRHFSCFYPPEDLAQGKPAEVLRIAAESGRCEDDGWRVRKDGSRFWAEDRITALRDDALNLRGFSNLTRDMTERKRAEETLRESQQRLSLAMECAGMGTWDWDIATDKTIWSEQMFRLLGYEPTPTGEARVEMWHSRVHPEDLDRVVWAIDQARREHTVFNPEHRVIRADNGQIVWLAVAGRFLYDESGAAVRMLSVLFDITERKRAEGVRSHLAAIVESSEDAIIGETLEGVITSWNQGAERIYGYPAEEVIGQSIDLLVPPERANELPQILERLQRGERIEHYETVRVRKDGRRLVISLTFSPIKDAQSQTIGASAIVRDITEQKRLEEELQQRVIQLAEADRRKDEFLAMLSHELRNPLAAIVNAVHIMRLNGVKDASLQRVEAVLGRQVEHMTRLLDDLLDVSRITRGKLVLNKEMLDLKKVVANAVQAMGPVIEGREQQLIVSLPPHPLPVEGDRTRLEQVLANLLNNAAKYTEPHGSIWLTASHEPGVLDPRQGGLEPRHGAIDCRQEQVVIRVRDTGMGIAPELLPRIFDPFTQGDQPLDRASGGLGIGLTLVRSLVEMHRGSVIATSGGPGQGSEFVVRLPLAVEWDAALGLQRAASAFVAEGRRILIVEDNADTRETLRELLQLCGHYVEEAEDGAQGIETIRSSHPDVALIDIGLPGLDGYQVAQRVRAAPDSRNVFLVALTGYGQPEDRRRALAAGFDAHLVKPVNLDQLSRLLANSMT